MGLLEKWSSSSGHGHLLKVLETPENPKVGTNNYNLRDARDSYHLVQGPKSSGDSRGQGQRAESREPRVNRETEYARDK